MIKYAHVYQLTATKVSGAPIKDTSISVGLRLNGENYEINPSFLNLLQIKQFIGDGKEDPSCFLYIDCDGV